MLPVPFRVVLKIAFKIAVFTIVLLKTDSFLMKLFAFTILNI